MTAEVSVMNRLGVSLAADSAVTVGQELDKIYASAEKLFLIAENAPIGVMVYGDGEFLNVPWETVIKVYRRHLGQKTFLTLEEYANDFVHFLGDNRALFPASAQEEFVRSFIRGYYLFLRDQLKDRLDNELQNRKLAEKDIKRIFSDLVQGELEQTKKADLLHQLPTGFSKTIGDKYQATIASEKKQIFESYPMSRTTNARLTRLAEESISRQLWQGRLSGVVFAGFGENEHFPSLIELIVEGMAAGQVLFWKNRTAVMGSDYPACIMPFAQGEMVATFMEGVDPQLKQMIESSTTTLFNGISQTILEQVKERDPSFGKELEERVSTTLGESLETLLKQWNTEREQRYSGPIMEIVAALPKDELAAMAESLVNLTKFKRRVSKQQETVGGPIDVAVITKGDGFVWVKRKHYFNAELNPRFMSRYYKERLQ